MARVADEYYPTGYMFRAVVTGFVDGREIGAEQFGPYSSIATARGVATRDIKSRGAGASYRVQIQRTIMGWDTVEEYTT